MVSPKSPNRRTTLRKSRRRLHRLKNKSPIQPHQMDQRKMAHLRPQTSRTPRRHNPLPTRRRMATSQPSRTCGHKPQKDSRIQTRQAIRPQHPSRQKSWKSSTKHQKPLKPKPHKPRIHIDAPPPLSKLSSPATAPSHPLCVCAPTPLYAPREGGHRPTNITQTA